MKNMFLITAVIFVTTFSAVITGAEGPKDIRSKGFASLMHGLQNGNKGLKISCALTLGECRFENATDLLCNILKSEEDTEVKFAALFALYKIGTDDAVTALESVSKSYGSPLKAAAEVFYIDLMRNENAEVKLAR